MRRFWLLVGLFAGVLSWGLPARAAGDLIWRPLGANGAERPARVAPVREGFERFEARVAVPGLLTGTEATPKGARGVIDIPGAGVTSTIGLPRLPVLRRLVEAPPGARVAVQLTPVSRRTLTLRELGIPGPLIPVQPPVPKLPGAEKQVPYVEDARAYALDAFAPEASVAILGEASLRGRRVVQIEVRPLRYNAARGLLEVWDDAVLAVTFEGGAPVAAEQLRTRLASKALDPAIEGETLNSAPFAPSPDNTTLGSGGGAAEGAEGLLVVVYDGFENAIQPLVEWKRKSGFKVEVVKTSTLGSPPTDAAVKNAIQSRFDSWSNPSLGFVLLVGDTDFCPIHTGNGGGSSQVTDNWYACTSGSDYLPDVAIARISTRTAQETTDVVDKLMLYEKATFTVDGWVKKAGFIGTSDSSHYTMIETTHDWCIDNYMTPNSYLQTPWSHGHSSSDRHYYTTNATTADISASINEGRSIVNYSGHGATDSWAGPTSNGQYTQTDVRNNTNDQMYPFVVSNACITGSLAVAECFGETWQKAPHKGAIAFWGASNNSYWDEDDYLQRQLYGNIFPLDSTPAVGVVVNQTKIDLYNHYGGTSTVAYYFDMYNLLSEPTLSVWTSQPKTLVVSHPASTPIGQNTFDVTVSSGGSPVSNALVAVRRTTDGVFESGYTDTAGAITLTLDPAPLSVGPMDVTVTKHDFGPYEGVSQVISPDTPWLTHRAHQVDDGAGGDGDGQANPGETIVMPVTVENVGQQPGTGLSATLTTSTPAWVGILDDSAAFPDLAVNQQGTSLPDHYRFKVAAAASDGVLLGFDLHWTAAGGASGTTSFSQTVAAVNFDFDHYDVDDSAGGNGNGVAGPGETVDMVVGVANAGHKDARTVHGTLSTTSPYITVLQAEADFPDIPASGAGDSEPPPFRFSVSQNAPDRQPVVFTLLLTEQGSGHAEAVTFDVMISSCATSASTDVPKSIQDYTTVDSVLDYPRDTTIGEINVFVDITHTYIGDLKITLISPAGTPVVLHNRSGSSTENIYTWYDTQTQPAEPLSRLNGENSRGLWTLRVADEAGGDVGTLNAWQLEVCGQSATPRPALSLASAVVDDAGSCNPDGYADVGETVTLRVTVQNPGAAAATGVRVSLTSSSRVEVRNNPVLLGGLGIGEAKAADFLVRIGAVSCMETATFSVSMVADQGLWGGVFTQLLEVDDDVATSTENLEHGGAAPAGWRHQALLGSDDWQIASTRNHTTAGQYSWFVTDPNKVKDDVLITPSYTLRVGTDSSLEFWHWIDSQDGYDGAVIELSADAGATWFDLASYITEGGYDKTLSGASPLAGRQAWTGTYTAWRRTTVNLAPWSGMTVLFRFRFASDGSTKKIGWWVDDVVVRTAGRGCDAHPCGVPGEVEQVRVTKTGGDVVVSWRGDVLALSYKVRRSPDPGDAGAFSDVTAEDSDPADTSFVDHSAGALAAFIITSVGPDGEGPWGHFER